MKTNASESELIQALENLNKKYDNNIKFRKLEHSGKKITFTLTVKSSKDKGSVFIEGKRRAAACWHAHGDFFDMLIAINPDVVIESSRTSKIDRFGGNWQDYIVGGSRFAPVYASDACKCE